MNAKAATTGSDDESEKLRRQFDFAKKYMEKLINIEVKVPVVAPTEASKIVLARDLAGAEGDGKSLWARNRRIVGYVGGAATVLLVLSAGWWAGDWVDKWTGVAGASSESSPERGWRISPEFDRDRVNIIVASLDERSEDRPGPGTLPPGNAEPSSPGTPNVGHDVVGRGTESKYAGPSDVAAGSADMYGWFTFVLLLGVIAPGVWGLRLRADETARDSREFRKALAMWLPILAADQGTPRAVKRFVNRVRYLAMLQRERDDRIHESVLVAIAALAKVFPGWADADPLPDLKAEIESRARDAWQPGESGPSVGKFEDAVQYCLHDLRRITPTLMSRYRELAAGVHLSGER
jgi:hypothetical protein